MIKNFIRSNNLEYYENISLKNYNTYKIDVIAKYLVFPKDKVELSNLVKYLKDNNCKFLVLGNGSNVIFSCSNYDGVVIRLDKLNDMLDASKKYKSFTGISDGMDGEVKFIFVMDK